MWICLTIFGCDMYITYMYVCIFNSCSLSLPKHPKYLLGGILTRTILLIPSIETLPYTLQVVWILWDLGPNLQGSGIKTLSLAIHGSLYVGLGFRVLYVGA